MFPNDVWFNPRWCLYDATNGRVLLKHPFRPDLEIPCPHCGMALLVTQYKAQCCGHTFKTSFGEIY